MQRRAIVRNAVLAMFGLAVLAYGINYGWRWWTEGRFLETTDNAYVRADVVVLAPRVAGYVSSVDVVDNQAVQPGQILFRIDDRDFRARVDQARADVAARQAALQGAKDQLQLQGSVIAQTEADVQAALAEVERTERDLERSAKLVQSSIVSVQTYDLMRANAAKANAATAAAKARVASERDRVSVLSAQKAAATAALAQAKAALGLSEIDLENTVVRAPIGGVVGNLQVRLGRYVQPGTQLLAVVPIESVYIVANFKETQVGHMQTGQRVRIEVDTYPDAVVTGRIDSLAPASGAQFALLPPDNATGNFTKVVQRIPVKIVVARDNPLASRLRPGMSVIANVDTKSRPAAEAGPRAEVSTR